MADKLEGLFQELRTAISHGASDVAVLTLYYRVVSLAGQERRPAFAAGAFTLLVEKRQELAMGIADVYGTHARSHLALNDELVLEYEPRFA